MNDIPTAEADSRMCWVSKDKKFHATNEFGGFQRYIGSTSNELKET